MTKEDGFLPPTQAGREIQLFWCNVYAMYMWEQCNTNNVIQISISRPSIKPRVWTVKHLKVLSRREGEAAQLQFLVAPALAQQRVADEQTGLDASVEVQGNVLWTPAP